jgi:outer membrane biosynthesis protein TonB
MVTPPPVQALAPAAPRAVPFAAPAASPVPPTVPFALSPASPVPPPAPFATPPVSPVPPPVLFSAPVVTPLSPLSAPVTPVAPLAAEPSASGPVFAGGVPTPQPVSVAPFGDVLAEPALVMPLPKPGLAGLLERQPGLKYVFAAVAIVGLILLLVLVILRGERQKPYEPAPAAPPEPAKVEEPRKVEEPKAAPSEMPLPSTPPSPPKVEEPKLAPAAPSPPVPAGKHGSKRGGRRAAVERPPKEKTAANPPRLAGARPNPFDDAKAVSQSQITAVVRNPANQAGLKSCYERALKMDNHLTSGRMDVTVSISAAGVVQRVVVNAPSNFIMVEPCIKSAVKRWSFPSNTEEYGTTFPLIMQGGM